MATSWSNGEVHSDVLLHCRIEPLLRVLVLYQDPRLDKKTNVVTTCPELLLVTHEEFCEFPDRVLANGYLYLERIVAVPSWRLTWKCVLWSKTQAESTFSKGPFLHPRTTDVLAKRLDSKALVAEYQILTRDQAFDRQLLAIGDAIAGAQSDIPNPKFIPVSGVFR